MNQDALMSQPIKKTFFQYTSLGIMSMIGTSLFILADTFFIANVVGADAITDVWITMTIVEVLTAIISIYILYIYRKRSSKK